MSFAADIDDRPLTLARERFERIYNTIRDRICLIEYEPGARLGEEELAREFGVSRTPVRRVLARLVPGEAYDLDALAELTGLQPAELLPVAGRSAPRARRDPENGARRPHGQARPAAT